MNASYLKITKLEHSVEGNVGHPKFSRKSTILKLWKTDGCIL